jgi:glycosyltransferase involved in cell wall biosynthesis
MSKALFLCDVEIDPREGIYKKVSEQARVISIMVGECRLCSKTKDKSTMVLFKNGEQKSIDDIENYYSHIKNELNDAELVYIRHMLPSPKQLILISHIKRKKCRLLYEIPTYPYFGEQIKSSPHKIRTSIRILVDIVAWPFIYQKVDKLVAIRSSSKVKVYKKMLLIPNGIARKNINPFPIVEHNNGVNFVVVGTLYPYHGIDRLLNAFWKYHSSHDNEDVWLHIVGSSAEIDSLRKLVEVNHIPKIIFHGRMSTDELMEFYPKMDVGVACLALYRRNADIDTTLKVVEYLCYGLPIISSGTFPIDNSVFSRIRINVSNDSHPIVLESILDQLKDISISDRVLEQRIALTELTWESIIRKMLS